MQPPKKKPSEGKVPEQVIAQLPSSKFTSTRLKEIKRNAKPGEDIQDKIECSVCQCEYEDGEL